MNVYCAMHPGTSKNKIKNASLMAMEFASAQAMDKVVETLVTIAEMYTD